MITTDSLEKVDNHWAVTAVGIEQRDRGLEVANRMLVQRAVGQQIEIDFSEDEDSVSLLRRLAMAYEMAAIEGLHAYLSPAHGDSELRQQFTAGAWRAFELRRSLTIPEHSEQGLFHVLHLSAVAYCGERWSDLRRWYSENEDLLMVAQREDDWDRRLLLQLFDCWVRLFWKRRWGDLEAIKTIIAGLRNEQETYENSILKEANGRAVERLVAFRLIALYHWAKSTELLALYTLQGEPFDIGSQLDKHFEGAIEAASASSDPQLEILLRWLYASAKQMVSNSIWWVSRAVNSRVSRFVRNLTEQQSMFELLPPQRTALQEQGLLDQANTAVVVEMPTSGGKTLLAQFRMLQALNQFDAEHGWVAYVAPTRALTSQITRRLRRDFEPIGVRVEQLTGALEIDVFEDDLLSGGATFDVLVATPEKLQLVIRNNKVPRPLALVVMDEAHNIEDDSRGLRVELLLATIKRECKSANFLLLMPYVEQAEKISRWLASDVNAGRTISIGSTPWKPNERIVGMFHSTPDNSVVGGWKLKFETLVTTPKTIHLSGEHSVGGVKPLNVAKSQLNRGLETAAISRVLAERGTSIAVATRIDTVWKMARKVSETLEYLSPVPEEIKLVQRFLRTEISRDFELIDMLSKGVGVHHAGLSDEVRSLIEWLAEEGKLRVLCATTTIAQGINFPVSSVFLSSRFLPDGSRSKEMTPREFWNLAGRAGRIDQDSVGVVGIAAGDHPTQIVEYVSRSTGELVSCLVKMLDELEESGRLNQLVRVLQTDQWEDFRCYVAHLWNEKRDLESVLANAEQLLRNTYGYETLRSSEEGSRKARALLDATRDYAKKLADNPGFAELADMTGFSPEGIGKALLGLNQLENKLELEDWTPRSLFGQGEGLADLFGVMLRVPQLSKSLREFVGEGEERRQIADITKAWVHGDSIQDIAQRFFHGDETEAITDTCRAIYRNLVNSGTWGIAALSRISGIAFDSMTESERRRINALPAMIYHGVQSEDAVLMRMNSVPRSIAKNIGDQFRSSLGGSEGSQANARQARDFLMNLNSDDWERFRPISAELTGRDYKDIWGLLSGVR